AVGGAARVDFDGATVDGQGVLPNVSDLEQLRRADVGRAASVNHADVGIAAGEVEDAVVDHGGGVERSAGDVGVAVAGRLLAGEDGAGDVEGSAAEIERAGRGVADFQIAEGLIDRATGHVEAAG